MCCLQPRFGLGDSRHVVRRARNASIGERGEREGKGPALAGERGKALGLHGLAVAMRGCGKIALGTVEGEIGRQRRLLGLARGSEKGTVDESERQILAADPGRYGHRIQGAAKIGAMGGLEPLRPEEDRQMPAGRASAQRQGPPVGGAAGQGEGGALRRQPVQGRGELRRIGTGEAGFHQLRAIAEADGLRIVRAPDQQGFTAGRKPGVTGREQGAGFCGGGAQGAPEDQIVLMLGKAPQPTRQRQGGGCGHDRQQHEIGGGAGIRGHRRRGAETREKGRNEEAQTAARKGASMPLPPRVGPLFLSSRPGTHARCPVRRKRRIIEESK